MQMVGKKKIRQMHPVCLTRLAPTGFWRGGAAKREQGESEVIRRHSSFPLQTRGRVTVGAVFFAMHPPTRLAHTYRLEGGRERRGAAVALHRVTAANPGSSGGAGARRRRKELYTG